METKTRSANALMTRGRSAFTLVEILIVVIILGILASIVVPQFSNATAESRENSLRMNLFRVRTQLQIYNSQHNGQWPDLASFEDQLTAQTDVSGNAGTEFGPYITEVPVNPVTGNNAVGGVLDYDPNTSDWYYDETTGDFRANDSAEHAAF